MVPANLTSESFDAYPPQGRKSVVARIELLRQLPLAFVPLLLREMIVYDWKFPAERLEMDLQFSWLAALPSAELSRAMAGFAAIRLNSQLERFDWVSAPGVFSEQLTSYLWSTNQIGAFRARATDFVNSFHEAKPKEPPTIPRLGLVAIGSGVAETNAGLFEKLRPHGTYFTNVNPQNGLPILIETLEARARAHPQPFAHWYISGGLEEVPRSKEVTFMSYGSISTIRSAIVAKMLAMRLRGSGTEELRTALGKLRPEDVGLAVGADDGVMDHFKLNVLAEGSGVQFFSTTFVQWAAREAMRRAQPLTLYARFMPRQTGKSMNELLNGGSGPPELDPEGSLIDADIGAYYTWLNLRRLPGASESSFLVWFEGHRHAIVVSRKFPSGAVSHDPSDLRELLEQIAV